MTWNMPPTGSEYGDWVRCHDLGSNVYMLFEDYVACQYQDMIDKEKDELEYILLDENMLDPFYNDELLGVSYVE